MTSDQIAESVGTNASYIRKITGLLKKQEYYYLLTGKPLLNPATMAGVSKYNKK